MENIFKSLLVVVMIMSLTGCGGGNGTKKSDNNSPIIDSNETGDSDKNPIDDSNETEDSDKNPIDDGNEIEDPDKNPIDDSNEIEDPDKNPIIITKKTTNNGNWIYIDDGTEEKIDKDFAYPIKYLGKNFIEVEKEDNITRILLRDGSPDGVVRGRLYTDIEFVQKLNKEKNEKITCLEPIFKKSKDAQKYTVIIDDGFNIQSKTVSANGKFNFSGVTTMKESRVIVLKGAVSVGDIEEIIGGDDDTELIIKNDENRTLIKNDDIIFDDNLSVKNEDTDLGNFPIPDKEDKYNFKVTKTIHEQDKDDRYMYENRTYKGKLTFTNTEKEMATALNYEITTSDPYVEELTHDIVMGSVEGGKSVEIPFEVTFGRLDKIAHRVKLDFLIKDVNGKQWLDNVYLDVYQTPINVNLKTKTSNLKGYFITPEHEIIAIDTKDIKVKIPNRPDSSYYFLVTSPKDIGAETAYSLGVDVNASEFEDFHDTRAYEPNNLEEKATKLQVGDSIKSYIHKGDIDFYTIDFQKSMSYEPPRLPFN